MLRVNPLLGWSWSRVCHLFRMDLRCYVFFFVSLALMSIALIQWDQVLDQRIFRQAATQNAWQLNLETLWFFFALLAYAYTGYKGLMFVSKAKASRMIESIYISKTTLFQWATSLLIQIELKLIWFVGLFVPVACYCTTLELTDGKDLFYQFAWVLSFSAFSFSALFACASYWKKLFLPLIVILCLLSLGYFSSAVTWESSLMRFSDLLEVISQYPLGSFFVIWILSLCLLYFSAKYLSVEICSDQTITRSRSSRKLQPLGNEPPLDWIQSHLLRCDSGFRNWLWFLFVAAIAFLAVTILMSVFLLVQGPAVQKSLSSMNAPLVYSAELFFSQFAKFVFMNLVAFLFCVSAVISVREDRIRQTWETLLVLPLSHADLILAKTKAVLSKQSFLWAAMGIYLVLRWLTNHGGSFVFATDFISMMAKCGVITLVTIFIAAKHERLSYWLPVHVLIILLMNFVFCFVISLSLAWLPSESTLEEFHLSKVFALDGAVYFVTGIIVYFTMISHCDLTMQKEQVRSELT